MTFNSKVYGMHVLLGCLILAGLCCQYVDSVPVFMGGTMTYEVIHYENDIIRAKVIALIGWKLGTGPCGAQCTSASIGTDTRATRSTMARRYGEDYFGSWTLEIGKQQSHYEIDVTHNVTSTLQETVADVNEIEGWELDRVEFTLDTPKMKRYVDVVFDGSPWRRTSLQPSVNSFHLQIQIETPSVRSDTGLFDRAPVVFMKPFYRLALNRTYNTEDFICIKDDDDDLILSEEAMFVEPGGQLSAHPFPGLEANNYAQFLLSDKWISSWNMRPNSTGIIALELPSQQFIKEPFTVAKNPLQFVVEIVSEDQSPVFVSAKNQQYFLYNGVSFNTTFTAMSPIPSRTISRIYISLDGNPYPTTSNLTHSSSNASLTVVWTPKDDINHVMCVTAEDNKGLRSSLMNCVNIFSKRYQTDHRTEGNILASNSSLYFTNFPVSGSIVCEVNTICRFPVFVTLKTPGAILDLRIKSTSSSSAKIVSNLSNLKPTSSHTKSVDVELSDKTYGLKSICFEAKTADGQTEECMYVTVNAKDPCKLHPCQHYGTCIPHLYNNNYTCHCTNVTKGRNCENYVDLCSTHQCQYNGTCLQRASTVYCMCTVGTHVRLCEQLTDLCSSSPCQHNGTCLQSGEQFQCICPAGTTGNCEQDVAPCEDISVRDCQDAKALQYICPDPASAKYCRKSCKLCHTENPSNIFG